MLDITLDRPLAVFDIESTGISPRADRIVELAIVRLDVDGIRTTQSWFVKPGIPIPEEAIAIHGITNDAVADAPEFGAVADDVLAFIRNCDLGGYNCLRFDIPILEEELIRVNRSLSLDDRRVVDAQRIYHKKEPRDLSAAVRFYCDKELEGAHGAKADAEATLDVIEGQLERYPDLPRSIDELDDYCNPRDPFWADRTGRLRWLDGEITINFGKKKGQPIRELVKTDRGFLKWMLRNDFPRDTLQIIGDAINDIFPPTPKVTAKSAPDPEDKK